MSYRDIEAAASDFEDETDPLLLEIDDAIDDTLEDETQSQQLAVRGCYRAAVMSMADER